MHGRPVTASKITGATACAIFFLLVSSWAFSRACACLTLSGTHPSDSAGAEEVEPGSTSLCDSSGRDAGVDSERAALASFDEFLEDVDFREEDDVCEMAWGLVGLVDGGEIPEVIKAGLLVTRM